MADWCGQTLGSYAVLTLLGQGAMGPVYKARDKRLERFVAVRLPPPQLVGDAQFLARFRREAAAATKFSHKNLVQVYDIGEYHRMPFIVAELVEGESLAGRLARKGQLPAADALATLLYVTKALAAAWHEARIIHLALKPASLLIARDGEIKLSDLGRALHVGHDAAPPAALDENAAPYASPELARGESHLDHRADIYSLGVILYQSITGRLPPPGTPLPMDLLPPDAPPELAQLLARMLAPDRNQRPDDYEHLLEELWQLDQRLVAASHPPPLPAPAQPRARWLWPALALGVIAVFAGLLTWGALRVKHIFAQRLTARAPVPTNATPHTTRPKHVAKPAPPPVSIAKPALPHDRWQDAVNLLKLIEPKRDSVTGHWTLENGAVVGTVGAKQRTARLEIDYEPPSEYDFRIEFTPLEAVGGGQHLTAFGHDFAWDFFSGSEKRACGFELVGSATLFLNPTCVMVPPVEKGRRYVSLVEVRKDGVRGFLDDRLVTEHKTDFADLDEAPYWRLHNDWRLGLGCAGRMIFHRIELREVSGHGRSPAAAEPPRPTMDSFVAEVAALPAAEQLKRVVAELQKLNAGYDGQEVHEIENGKVVVLALNSPALIRLAPVRALTALQSFRIGTDDLQGPRYPLADLRPLHNLPLTSLVCNRTEVSELAPLRGMALTNLKCAGSPIRNLNALRGMALLELDCRQTAVTDLAPLRRMPLRYLYCDVVVATNGPNRGVIRSLDKLEEINGRDPAEFWRQPCDYAPPTGKPVIRRD